MHNKSVNISIYAHTGFRPRVVGFTVRHIFRHNASLPDSATGESLGCQVGTRWVMNLY